MHFGLFGSPKGTSAVARRAETIKSNHLDMPYPAWVVRRLRQQAHEFNLGDGTETFNFIRQSYASFNPLSSRHIDQMHIDWLGRAWMVAGAHVPIPPPRFLPGILHFLNQLLTEDPLMEGWLLDLAATHACVPDWRCRKEFQYLSRQLREKRVRWYWSWLCRVIRQRCEICAEPSDEWARQVVATRVVAHLYRQVGLAGLVRRIDLWVDFDSSPSEAPRPAEKSKVKHLTIPLLDSQEEFALSRVIVRHLSSEDDLIREGEEMKNCTAQHSAQVHARKELFFSLYDPLRGARATLELQVETSGNWHIVDLRNRRNRRSDDRGLMARTSRGICAQLGQYGTSHPLLAECLQMARGSDARRRAHECITASDHLLHRFVPGIGKANPEDVLRKLWASQTAPIQSSPPNHAQDCRSACTRRRTST
jgi:hypothetical protein